MRKKIILVSIVSAAAALCILLTVIFKKDMPVNEVIGGEDGSVVITTTENRKMYTKESLLNELLGIEPFEVEEKGDVRTEKFQNGAIATIKDNEVEVAIGDDVFSYSLSQYRVAVPFKEIPTLIAKKKKEESVTTTTKETVETTETTETTTTKVQETTTSTTKHTHKWKEVKHTESYIDHSADVEEKTYAYDVISNGEVFGTYDSLEDANAALVGEQYVQTRETGTKINHSGDVKKKREVFDYYECSICGERKYK